jgi:hypothetical protein
MYDLKFFKKFVISIICLSTLSVFSKNTHVFKISELNKNSIKTYLKAAKALSSTQIKYLKHEKTIVNSLSTTQGKFQSLDFYISKLHPNSCSNALIKLSTFEKYKDYLGFIDKSTYLEKTKEVYFYIKSALLPYNMSLKFKLPRVEKAGLYPFTFDTGIFSGLSGHILALEFGEKCLIYTQAKWHGKHTRIPSFAIEIFSETLSRLSMNKVFRATTI